MCGIVFVHKRTGNSAGKSVNKRYAFQKERGKEGFGYLATNNSGVITKFMRCTDEKSALDALRSEKSPLIMFHHRFPTSTPNYAEAAHPIEVNHNALDYKYYLVHNGVIGNDQELKKRHVSKGFTYTTLGQKFIKTRKKRSLLNYFYNDSECLAIEMALAVEKGASSIEVEGSLAFILAQVDKKTNVVRSFYFGRNFGSPLKIDQQNGMVTLTSQSKSATVLDVAANELFCYDVVSGAITSKPFIFGSQATSVKKFLTDEEEDWEAYNGYPYQDDSMGFQQEAKLPDSMPHFTKSIVEKVRGNIAISEAEYNHLMAEWKDKEASLESMTRVLHKAMQESNFDLENAMKAKIDAEEIVFCALDDALYSVDSVVTPNGLKRVSVSLSDE